MNIFGRSADELVFDLIARDNPTLTPALTTENAYITNVSVNAESDSALYNTKALVTARPGGNWTGRLYVKYNRINLSDLFKDVVPKVTAYSSTGKASGMTHQTVATAIRNKFQLDLAASQFTTTAITSSTVTTAVTVTVTMTGFNRAFYGSLSVLATPSTIQPITYYLPTPTVLAAITDPYPGFDGLPAPEYYFSNIDFSAIEANLTAQATGVIFSIANATAVGTMLDVEWLSVAASASVQPTADSPFRAGLNQMVVTKGLTSALAATYPFIDTSYSHVLITRLNKHPISLGTYSASEYRYFAFHYNKAV